MDLHAKATAFLGGWGAQDEDDIQWICMPKRWLSLVDGVPRMKRTSSGRGCRALGCAVGIGSDSALAGALAEDRWKAPALGSLRQPLLI